MKNEVNHALTAKKNNLFTFTVKKKSLLTFILCILATFSGFAADYAPMGDLPASPSQSSTLPFYTASGTYTSITQQLYYASEMIAAGAEAGDITALKFYFGNNSTTVREVTRNLEIYIKLVPTTFTEFEVGFTNTDKYTYKFTNPGSSANKVFDGNYTIPATSVSGAKIERTINTSSFYWDGTSNILVTIIDKTNKKFNSISGDDYSDSNLKSYGKVPAVTASRFVHQYWTQESSSEFTTYKNSLDGKFGYCSKNSTTESTERTAHSYVNIIKFTIEPAAAPTVPAIPEDLAASNVGATSASLSWTAVDGADSYKLLYSTDGTVYVLFATPTTNSYSWTGLTANTTYYVQVAAANTVGTSDYSDAISFTTLAPHIHDGITFEPWSNASALPTSGNYYLATDVAYDFYEGGYLDLAGDLNLCLNGYTINLGTKSINVTGAHTMTIYDPVGGGKITGFVPGTAGSLDFKGVISVESYATLVLREGEVENTYPNDDPEYKSIAIAVGGTLILSGAPAITSNEMDIYLPPTIPAKVITIESGKPLTNTTPYKVYKSAGVITSGWANMSGADPKDYFVSANTEKSIYLNDGEAVLIDILNLSEESTNTSIGTHYNQLVDVNLTRSLTSSQYNTFCLPFNLTNAQLEAIFGAGYDLEELVSTYMDEEWLSLEFNKVNALEAGKPYLIQPTANVVNPYFEAVTITATAAGKSETTYVDFYSTFAPTELEGGNKSLLFLGAGNELFYPEATANIKAFRAYFELKGAAKLSAPKARIVHKEDPTQIINNIKNPNAAQKRIIDGQLVIEKNGMLFNAQGQIIVK